MKMKKFLRRGVVGLLSVLLSVTCGGGVFAAAAAKSTAKTPAKTTTCTCPEIPRVYVYGFGQRLYLNEGQPEEILLDEVDYEGLKKSILPAAQKFLQAAYRKDWSSCEEAISGVLWGLFGQLQMDETGKSVLPVSRKQPLDKNQNHKEDSGYPFHYDWRQDPYQSAQELHEYIQKVKQSTGHPKIALISFSQGGVVSMGYFARYGYGDVASYMAVQSAHNGLTMVGELFHKNIEFDAFLISEYFRRVGYHTDDEGTTLLAALGDILRQSGLDRQLSLVLNRVMQEVGERVFDETLQPLFVHWPALWAFVPHEYYESAKKTLLSDPKYKGFVKMIDRFHNLAGAGYKADGLIKGAVKAGVKVSIVATYGHSAMPFTPNASFDADGLIDTARSSSGAMTAGVGKTFPQNYKQKVQDGHDHISPDRQVDASTCLLPEQTWFVRDLIHFNWGLQKFEDFLVYSKKQPTIHDDPEYPQFLTYLKGRPLVMQIGVPLLPVQTIPQSLGKIFVYGWNALWTEVSVGYQKFVSDTETALKNFFQQNNLK